MALPKVSAVMPVPSEMKKTVRLGMMSVDGLGRVSAGMSLIVLCFDAYNPGNPNRFPHAPL